VTFADVANDCAEQYSVLVEAILNRQRPEASVTLPQHRILGSQAAQGELKFLSAAPILDVQYLQA
jgi:CRISPR/Cas system CMR subunit Cmr6 (Cas7 group RAMP superfamily)